MLPSFLCFLSAIVSISSLEQITEISELEWNNSVVGFDDILEWEDETPKIDFESILEIHVTVIDTVFEAVSDNPVIETVLETVKDNIVIDTVLETVKDNIVIDTVLETVSDNLLPLLESVKQTPFEQNETEPDTGAEKNNTSSSKLPFNFSWLIPGHLAGTNCPTTEEELVSIHSTGVRYFVTLSPEYQPKHHKLNPQHLPDLLHFNIFFNDFTAPSLDSILAFEKVSRKAREEGASMVVHCRWGYGRTGTMLAIYLVTFLEMSPEEALLEVRQKRPWSVETKEQEQVIEDWAEFLKERKNLENEKLENAQQNQIDYVKHADIKV